MWGIMLAMFLSALEQTIVAPALPTIGRTLGDVENLSWVVSAYLLANTAAVPLFGKLSDIYGRRRMLLLTTLIFVVGLGGLRACAQHAGADRGPRAAGHRRRRHPADRLHRHRRHGLAARAAALPEPTRRSCFSPPSILGPVLGGVLTDYVHWTMIFWINLPLGVLALWMTDRALRKLPRNDRPHQLDMPGAVLMVGAALSLMLAMSWGGTRYGWVSGPILGLLAGSLRVVGAVRASRRDRAGAVHSACDPARADCRGGRHRGLLQRRRR